MATVTTEVTATETREATVVTSMIVTEATEIMIVMAAMTMMVTTAMGSTKILREAGFKLFMIVEIHMSLTYSSLFLSLKIHLFCE